MFKTAYQRRLFATLFVMVLCAPAVAWYGLAAMRHIRTSPSLWVPDSFQKRREYDWFERTFETNDAVIISWDGCTLDDERLNRLYHALHEPDDSPDGRLLREYVGRVFTGKTLMDAMTDYPLELPKEQAKARLSEALIGTKEETIFQDDGSQSPSRGGWAVETDEGAEVSSDGSKIVFSRASQDSQAEAGVTRTIDTTGYDEITVNLATSSSGAFQQGNGAFRLEYDLGDGGGFQDVDFNSLLSTPSLLHFQLPEDAAGRQQLQLRIRANFGADDERTSLDSVTVLGALPETTCCVVLLTDLGVGERQHTVPLLRRTALKETGLPEADLRMVGPVFDAYSIDVESVSSMRTFIIPSALIVILLCRFCLRSWVYTSLVFGIAVFGELLTLALVYGGDALFSFGPMNAVLIVMPPLVMVLTVSAAVHLVNYYHDEVRRHGFHEAPRKALHNGLVPCLLATGTTAIGLLSLVLSDIIPVKLFGIYATCGIGTTLALLFLTLPGAEERWPVPPREERMSALKDLSGLSNLVTRFPMLFVILGFVLMGVCGWGLQYMRTSVNVRSLFTPDSRILSDYQWFEKHIGPMTPVEVVLHFDKDSELDELERLEIVGEMQRAVASIDEIHGTMSAATFYPAIPRGFAERRATAIRMRRAEQTFDDINYTAIFDHFVALDPGESIRFEGVDDEKYAHLTVEGWTGTPGEPEAGEGWAVTPWDERHHFAYVFHGENVAIYLDGQRLDDASGKVLPEVKRVGEGAIVLANRQTDAPLALDGLRFSRVARYWRNFTPSERLWDRDKETIALFYFGDVDGAKIRDDLGLHSVTLRDGQKRKRRFPDESWRIGGRVAALGDPTEPEIDYGEFLAEIQHQIDPRLWAVHYMRDVRKAFRDVSRRDLADKRLLILGAPLHIPKPADGARPIYASSDEKTAVIFTDQLTKLLQERGFAPENIEAIDVGASVSDQQLAAADMVVLVRDWPALAAQRVEKHASKMLDARTHNVILDPEDPSDTRIVRATYTGVMPLAYEVQNALLSDLIKSFLTAVVLVTAVMMVVQRSPIAGLVAMLPNVFPMIILFGLTSGCGMAIDIGTVMTASVALGIAVDDTLHFLSWFNREHSETGDNVAGVKLAFRHCATAMLQTTMICSLGLVIYSFSWFMPTRRFSWMMVSLLIAAVIGDLVFLPALLSSPIGKCFPRRKRSGDAPPDKDAPQPETAPAEAV